MWPNTKGYSKEQLKKRGMLLYVFGLLPLFSIFAVFAIFLTSWTTPIARDYASDFQEGLSKGSYISTNDFGQNTQQKYDDEKSILAQFGKPCNQTTVRWYKDSYTFKFWRNTNMGAGKEVMMVVKNDEIKNLVYGVRQHLMNYIYNKRYEELSKKENANQLDVEDQVIDAFEWEDQENPLKFTYSEGNDRG